MISIIDKIMGGVVLSYVLILIWSKILNKKISYKEYSFYCCLIILTIATTLNYYFVNNFIKIIIISIFMVICCFLLFRITMKESVLTIIIAQIIFMISDGIVAILFTFVFNLNSYTANLQLSSFLINLVASIISLALFYLLFVRKLYNLILTKTKKLKNFEVAALCLCIIVFGNLFAMSIYNKVNFRFIILINIIFTLFCCLIVLYSLKTKNNYNKVNDKYNTTLNSLKEYESMLDKHRISSHENKNQLLTIRNMLPEDNIELRLYIDKILKNKQKDDDKIMAESVVIPSGGLRGLIYSKLLCMKSLKIKYKLLISKDIKTLNLLKLDDELMLDICKIIGVYLDNAINAVRKLRSKYINIEMYMEDGKMIVSISNNYNGVINIEKIDEVGYSSNGEGHGYGLALAKQIIDNNKKLTNEKKLSKDVFSQILKIKV